MGLSLSKPTMQPRGNVSKRITRACAPSAMNGATHTTPHVHRADAKDWPLVFFGMEATSSMPVKKRNVGASVRVEAPFSTISHCITFECSREEVPGSARRTERKPPRSGKPKRSTAAPGTAIHSATHSTGITLMGALEKKSINVLSGLVLPSSSSSIT